MTFSLRFAPALLLLFLILTTSTSAQTTQKTPRGTISGRITIKDKPAAGVIVGARTSSRKNYFGHATVAKAVTDQDGYYRITNLAAASYEIVPSVPAFVVSGQNPAKSKIVIVGEDETVDDINFTLERGGVITGRVTDADNRPVIQQQVRLYRYDAMESTPEPRPDFSGINVTTDDRGIYRMFGLPGGRYKVAAGRGDDGFSPNDGPARLNYKQVFHPDVTDHAKAPVVEVVEGSEIRNVDIALGRALQVFSASGKVVNEKGAAVPGVRFGLHRIEDGRTEFVSAFVISADKGEFMIEGLIPGKYNTFLFPDQGENVHVQSVPFDIIDQDVTGLTIKISKGGTIHGVVALETEDKTAFEKLSKLQLRAFVSVGAGFGGMSSSAISPDGSFQLGGLPAGTVNIILSSMMNPMSSGNFIISRVERDGAVLLSYLEIKEGETITGIRLVVVQGTGTVRGVVKIENGSLPSGGYLNVRLAKPGDGNRYMRPAQVDARGHFVIESVPPGVYELWATVYGPNMQPGQTAKRDITVQEGPAPEVVITLDMSAPRKP